MAKIKTEQKSQPVAPAVKKPEHLCEDCGNMFSNLGENSELKSMCLLTGSAISDKIKECSQYK